MPEWPNSTIIPTRSEKSAQPLYDTLAKQKEQTEKLSLRDSTQE